jgi:hypothetical protein
MKKLTILIAILITTMSFAQVPNYVPTNGLVGWWPFNGNAYDESGNGNNGIVNGASLTTDRFGNVNKAYNFNGNNTFVEVPSNSNLQLTNNYSINGWFQANFFFNSGTSDRSIISKVQSSGWYDGYEVMVGGTTNAISHVGNVGGNNFVLGSTGYLINTWYMFTVTYNGNTMNLFMNGELVITQPTSGNLQTGSLPLRFGMRDGSIQYFDGKIDDIGIWNRALTACEIQNLYTSTNPINTTTTASCNSYTWNGQTYTQSGVYTGTTTNCVTESLNLTINSSTSSTQTQTALDTYTWPLNNQTYTQGGTYTATIPNAAGCDSVVTLNLTLNYTGINEPNSNLVSISPNPTTSKITVRASLALIGKEFTIYDQLGKAVKSGIITAEETEIDLSNLSEGVYLFKAGAEMQETFKIIKQ